MISIEQKYGFFRAGRPYFRATWTWEKFRRSSYYPPSEKAEAEMEMAGVHAVLVGLGDCAGHPDNCYGD